MKIGILTFIHTRNFGANLQCFALQHQLSLMGYDVEVINLYRPIDKGYILCSNDKKRFPILYSYNSLNDYRAKFNKFVVSFIHKISRNKKSELQDGFIDFQRKFIRFSNEEYRNFTELYVNFPQDKYTHLIVGSDQVWNYSAGFSKEPFFLTFAHKARKISYAPSLGHDNIPAKVENLIKSWLSDFASVSVREDNASQLFSQLLNRHVPQVLDPTLLFNKESWLRAMDIASEDKEQFVLVYMLSVSSQAIEFAKVIANKLNCSVQIITSRPYYSNLENCRFLHHEDPVSFIEKFSKARFVVTNSFHGTAFSINFNIPFVTVEKKSSRLNSRKESLVKLFKLEKRRIFEGGKYAPNDYLSCDFTKANSILEVERLKSIKFIEDSLNS